MYGGERYRRPLDALSRLCAFCCTATTWCERLFPFFLLLCYP